ncbi:MAG TPA: hypothetical protein VF483_04460 [Gemmatimonadaceae bacterium]
MTAINDWEHWEAAWRAERLSPAALDDLLSRTRRARAGVVLMRLLSFTVVVAALGVVGAALWHAANQFEAALGLVVAFGITVVWWLNRSNDRSAAQGVGAPPDEYFNARRALCLRRVRFAQLSWLVVALDLVFLVPWWKGGVAVHGLGFSRLLLTVWGPLAGMLAFVWWTSRVRRQALAELERLPTSPLDS